MELPNPMYDPNMEIDENRRRIRITRIALALVLLLVLGMGGYGYSLYRGQELQLAQIPGAQATLTSLGGQINEIQQTIASWGQDQKGLREQLAKFEKSTRANLQLTRKFAEDVAKDLHVQLTAEMDRRDTALNARLDQIGAQQKTQQAQLAALRQEVREELTALRQDTQRDLGKVNERIDENGRGLDELAEQQKPQRVDFEVPRSRTIELTPAVHFRVTKTNVKQQRFDGWVQLQPKGRALWVYNQNVNQPVRVYPTRGEPAYELVITDVGKDFALGYLLLPKPSSDTLRGSATPGTSAASDSSAKQQ